MLGTARQLAWRSMFATARDMAEKHAADAKSIAAAIEGLPRDGFLDLWRNSDEQLFLNVGDWIDGDHLAKWKDALAPFGEVEVGDEVGNPGDDWVKIAFNYREMPCTIKAAYSKAMRGLGQAAGYLPGGWADQIGGPTPLSASLAGGLIGAGLGYGAGYLGEKVLPESWQRGRMKKTLALLGGMAGATPGAMMAADNWRTGNPINSNRFTDYPLDEAQRYLRITEDGSPNPDFEPDMPFVPDYKTACGSVSGMVPDFVKVSASRTGYSFDSPGFDPAPIIPMDQFNQSLYQDPHLSPQIQAAASGLMEAAYHTRGGGPRLIRPADIARISAGMGTGYLSGAIVGKALGALIGMPEPTQKRLRQTGMWAGVVANLVPLAFGAR